jgi:hypothetical protein
VTEPGDRVDGRRSTIDDPRASGEEELTPARDSFWALVPRRELVQALFMLLILVVVVVLRLRAVPLAETFRNVLAPREAPRVRMVPPPEKARRE